jgi:hypothetical protein
MRRYQVTVATDSDPYHPISGLLSFVVAKSSMEAFREPGEGLPIDRLGRRLSIVIIQKAPDPTGPAQGELW